VETQFTLAMKGAENDSLDKLEAETRATAIRTVADLLQVGSLLQSTDYCKCNSKSNCVCNL